MIRENPYMQYFQDLPGYEDKEPFDSSSLTNFRKRLILEMIREINEHLILEHEESAVDKNNSNDDEPKNK
jgi:hypothetical protein